MASRRGMMATRSRGPSKPIQELDARELPPPPAVAAATALKTSETSKSATLAHTEMEDEVPYSFLTIPDTMTYHPSEFHQAAVHYCTHPKVPTRWKFFYLLVSAATISLQILALLGLMGDIAPLTVPDILSLYKDMGRLDWFMSLLVAFLTAFSVQSEMTQARLAEMMVRKATLFGPDRLEGTADDSQHVWSSILWAIPLILIQRVRLQVIEGIFCSHAPCSSSSPLPSPRLCPPDTSCR